MHRPVGYLRDRSIGFKLGLIMLVPTLATVVVGFGALAANIGTAHNADRARILAGVTGDTGKLVHDLQNERAAATMMLAQNDSGAKRAAAAQFDGFTKSSDDDVHAYTAHKAALTGLPATFRTLLGTIDTGITDLGKVRDQLRHAPTTITTATATTTYTSLISNLIAIRDSAAQLAGDTALSYEMRAGAAVSQYKEYVSQERIDVLMILDSGQVTTDSADQVIGTLKGQELALNAFKVVATPDQQNMETQQISGTDVKQAGTWGDRVIHAGGTPTKNLGFTADQWDRALLNWSNLIRGVETGIDDQTGTDARKLRDAAQSQVYLDSALLAALVLFAVLIAWLVARSMARSLRELRHGALGIAQFGLPQAVARLRDPSLSTQMSPQEVARQIAEPLPVRSRDEFGQVTEAFNAVHLEAVRTAAEQAALRSSVSTMFVNLARRSQILVDRLIGHLDRLERGEEDPDRLAELFQLDHLATRMRRNDENLLVLAGADSTRVQREPAALIDVLRAAQSEVEHYTRIEFGVIDRDIEVAAHAVNDLVHLVAELFDNATAFSPPDSTVIVEARRVGDRAVLYVEDHGIGISPEQLADLNERLATPPMVDVAVSRMMGLVVVARLAARHGVKVELRPAPERGTVADALLPTSVLVPRGAVGRAPGTPLVREMPAPGRPIPPNQPRAPFTSPLALESGPTGTGGGRSPAGAGSAPGTPAGTPGPSMGGFGAGPGGYSGGGNWPSGATAGATPSGGPPAVPTGFNRDHSSSPHRHSAEGNGRGPASSSGRHLPPWSDLTGAAGGGLAGGGLAGRLAGNGGADRGNTNGSDVVGAQQPPAPPGAGEPLPQRRSPDRPAETDDRRIPRQVPTSPEAQHRPPTDQSEPVDTDVVDEAPAASAPSVPPPAWPPVPPGTVGEPAEGAAPPVPEELAAALDITSEMPRVRAEGEAPAAGPEGEDPAAPDAWNIGSGSYRQVGMPATVPAPYAAPAPPLPQQPVEERLVAPRPTPARVKAYADETMELPIFRELESAWFQTRKPGPESALTQPAGRPAPRGPERAATAPPAGAPAGAYVPPAASPPPVVPDGGPGRGADSPPAERGPLPEPVWRSSADEGWVAASHAADPQVDGTTSAGLPRRVPMAQLVPGGVEKEKAATVVNRRSPDQVRGLLSAYHRGVQRGRTRTGDDVKPPESTTTGNSPQGGKEQEA